LPRHHRFVTRAIRPEEGNLRIQRVFARCDVRLLFVSRRAEAVRLAGEHENLQMLAVCLQR
jgi:hypothetical protein